jgi:hypothetical protein
MEIFYYMYLFLEEFFETIYPQLNPDFFDEDNVEKMTE